MFSGWIKWSKMQFKSHGFRGTFQKTNRQSFPPCQPQSEDRFHVHFTRSLNIFWQTFQKFKWAGRLQMWTLTGQKSAGAQKYLYINLRVSCLSHHTECVSGKQIIIHSHPRQITVTLPHKVKSMQCKQTCEHCFSKLIPELKRSLVCMFHTN